MLQPEKINRVLDILLVEDNQGDAFLTYEAFKACKTPVALIRVKDGEEAMLYLRKEGPYVGVRVPDLILLDLNMPKKNGLEVLKEVKSDHRLREIPVMILTSSQSNRDTEDTYEAKANFYIVKPSSPEGFYEVMKYVEEIWLSSLQYRDASEKS